MGVISEIDTYNFTRNTPNKKMLPVDFPNSTFFNLTCTVNEYFGSHTYTLSYPD